MTIRNKTVLLTGGTQGLGKELARILCERGAKVIILARWSDFLDNSEVRLIQADVSDISQIETAAKELANEQIDILINNAGVWTTNDLEKENLARREETIKTNLLGVINVTDTFLPNIIKSNSPQIIFVNSIAATIEFGGEGADWSTYNASKWGVKGYMIALRNRKDLNKIKIGAIYPGGFESNIYENAGDGPEEEYHNQPWMMQTKTVADAIMFMLDQPADANVAELILTKHF